AVIMAEGRLIDAADLELAPAAYAAPTLDLRAARLRAEREVLQLALARANGTLSVAAKLLGISRPTLYDLLDAHGIAPEAAKAVGDSDLDLE
ncbi:MAG TPA: helix-turn-helix domain-containing protein, partial [Acetobacteraceae bacterium]|nr:helix-turn-helix domain-containing protein [Acetobacteraceae bacterium]